MKAKTPNQPAVKSKQPYVRPRKPVMPAHLKRPKEEIQLELCERLAAGESLDQACRSIADAPTPVGVLKWTVTDPDGFGEQYAKARDIGYRLLGDRVRQIASETYATTYIHKRDENGNLLYDEDGEPQKEKVLVPLSSEVVASKRLQVDTLKWQLSKMLPKLYGDRITQEITGAGGGPLQLTAANLRGLSDEEIVIMERLLSKAAAAASKQGQQ